MSLIRALGLMSGTSMDGVDVALIKTDGDSRVTQGPSSFRPYSPDERALLRAALADAIGLTDRDARPGALAAAEAMVTRAHAEAVAAFFAETGIAAAGVDLVGFHGQTVLHRPADRLTVQIGDGAALARACGRPVVFDLRAADVAAGGQGAPLVPVYHLALCRQARLDLPDLLETIAVLNLGGVSNVTLIQGDRLVLATDAGPANAPLDDFVQARRGVAYDDGGRLAASGQVDAGILGRLLADGFFDEKPPKSLDRNHFDTRAVGALSDADGAATLTAFIAGALGRLCEHLPARPDLWIACGGGARNPTLLGMIVQAVGAPVRTADDLGWSADAMEAQAFAYLAVRSQMGLPLTFPETTGVREPILGGVRAEPESRAR